MGKNKFQILCKALQYGTKADLGYLYKVHFSPRVWSHKTLDPDLRKMWLKNGYWGNRGADLLYLSVGWSNNNGVKEGNHNILVPTSDL